MIKKSKIIRIPIISIISGIILSLIQDLIIYMIMNFKAMQQAYIADNIFWISGTLISIGLIIFFGLTYINDMTKMEILYSALIVVLYYVLFLIGQQILKSRGGVVASYQMLYTPLFLYEFVHSLIVKFMNITIWIGLVPSIFSPFIFILFGRGKVQ